MRFIHIELIGFPSALPPPPSIKIGDKVKVKASVSFPRYKWGSVNHNSIGIVTSIGSNSKDLKVDFPQHSNWTGLISEMEVILINVLKYWYNVRSFKTKNKIN